MKKVENLKESIILNEQEMEGIYDASIFASSKKYMATGFIETFGLFAPLVFTQAIDMIMAKYPSNASYFQTFSCSYKNKTISFWLILDNYGDGEYVLTALLPEDY